jgi:RimJ/RimL family protein N-acetyltransferase
MTDVFAKCPIFTSTHYLARQTTPKDANDLLQVYSDPAAVPLFNSDNCGGDDFHYQTLARMTKAIAYWQTEYAYHGFVRWSIIDRQTKKAIGTVEIFDRHADDFFDDTAILRLDLRSVYEQSEAIAEIMNLFLPQITNYFVSSNVATKAPRAAHARIDALKQLGFTGSSEVLVGHDGTAYTDYFTLPTRLAAIKVN